MFTARTWDPAEAQLGESKRSQRATFRGFLSKPSDLEVLLNPVDCVVQDPVGSARSIQRCAPRSSTADTSVARCLDTPETRMGARRMGPFAEEALPPTPPHRADSSSRESRA
jgi:hypothetical protein